MLGHRIAKLRREAGLSQAELARRLDISASAVGMYEQGRREPAADILVKLSDLLGVSVDYLLTGSCMRRLHPLEQRLFQRIASADLKLEQRKDRPFSREELALIITALHLDEETA